MIPLSFRAALCLFAGLVPHATQASLQVLPVSGSTWAVVDETGPLAEIAFQGWGPGWQYLSWKGGPVAEGAASRVELTSSALKGGATLAIRARLSMEEGNRLVLETETSASKDTELTLVTVAVMPDKERFRGGALAFTKADGTAGRLELPLDKRGSGPGTASLNYQGNGGATLSVALDPPLEVAADGATRILLANKTLSAASPAQARLAFTLPASATFYADMQTVPFEPGFDEWFPAPLQAAPEAEDEISLASWLDAPAGRHGRVTSKQDRLILQGKPFKAWGINLCYADCAPPKELAEKRAAFYARNGINAVRLHKYADGDGWAGILKPGRWAEFNPEALDRMDYFVAKLKEKGIYVKLSPVFIIKPGAEDVDTVPYLSEFGSVQGKGRVNTKHGSIYLSTELQDLQIRQLVNLLKHRNPYTGLTYAEDPAVMVVELYNEDSVLFFGTMGQLKNVPTLRRRISRQFTEWLEKKYPTQDAWRAAWGPDALNSLAGEGFTNESWEEKTIVPAGNPWFYDPVQLAGSQAPKKRRLLDTMQFLYELQNTFYSRYAEALRQAGYTGEILASNWIAGTAYSHFLNLHSDARIGMVDRHNYFGGMGNTMLDRPGSGVFSIGLNTQVADRPYMLSEWIHTNPNEFGVEGPAVLGAYAMGLQDWDVSFIFQNRDNGGFSDRIGREEWDATAPQIMGLFPAVARQVLRGDVAASPKTIPRFVHVPSLGEGKLGFDDRGSASGDVKTADSATVPAAALAVGRVTIEFTEAFQETPKFDLAPHQEGTAIRSMTRELLWQPGTGARTGWFTVDTEATQAVVGFSGGRKFTLKDVVIEPTTRFSAIYLTARDRAETVRSGKNLLVTAIARARNTGMKVVHDRFILDRGQPPILMEPVKARVTLTRPGTPTVHVLDGSGRRTGQTVPVENGGFTIDGARDKTCYYLITY